MQQEEIIAQLKQRIAALERENDLLRAKLNHWQLQHGFQERIVELTKLNEALQTEVAERKRAEQIARGQTEVLTRTLNTLITNPELDQFLRQVLLVITEQLDVPACTVWLYDPLEDIHWLHMMCNEGVIITEQHQLGHPRATESVRANDKTWLTKFRAHQALVCDDIANESAFPPAVKDYLLSLGVKVLLNVPLVLEQEVIGTLSIRNTKRTRFTPEEIELAQALAHQATLALQLSRLAEQAKIAAILEERNRLAGEIHDTLAQTFTGISIQLGVAKRIAKQQPEEAQKILERVNQLAQTGLAEARRSIWELYPPAAEYTDLTQLLSRCIEQMTSGTQVHTEFTIEGTPCPLSTIVGMNLLRIGQEALTNTLRHARAQTIWIELAYQPDYVCLCVRDNGQGFVPQAAHGGFGLMGMYQRAERIGSRLSITSQLGQGTEIIVQVPLLQPTPGRKL